MEKLAFDPLNGKFYDSDGREYTPAVLYELQPMAQHPDNSELLVPAGEPIPIHQEVTLTTSTTALNEPAQPESTVTASEREQ